MLLTPKEAKERLRISLSLVYQLVDERRLKAIRIGGEGKRGKVLIEESEIERFVRQLKDEE